MIDDIHDLSGLTDQTFYTILAIPKHLLVQARCHPVEQSLGLNNLNLSVVVNSTVLS